MGEEECFAIIKVAVEKLIYDNIFFKVLLKVNSYWQCDGYLL